MDNLVDRVNDFFEDFSINVHTLQNPSCKSVLLFYERALLELNVKVENISKPQVNQHVLEDHDQQYMCNILRALRTTFPFLLLGLIDLLNPTSKKHIQHVKKLMDFLKFSDGLAAHFYEATDPYKEKKTQFQSRLLQKEDLVEKMNDSTLSKEKIDANLSLFTEAVKKEKLELDELINKTKLISEEVSELKHKKSEMLTNNPKDVMPKLLEDIEMLENLIKNPFGSVPEEIAKKENEREKLTGITSEVWDRIKEKKKEVSLYNKYSDDFQKNLKKFGKMIDLIKKQQSMLPDIVELEKRETSAQEEIENDLKKVSELEQILSKENNDSSILIKINMLEQLKHSIIKKKMSVDQLEKKIVLTSECRVNLEEQIDVLTKTNEYLLIKHKELLDTRHSSKTELQLKFDQQLDKMRKLFNQKLKPPIN